MKNKLENKAFEGVRDFMTRKGYQCKYEISNGIKLYTYHKEFKDIYLRINVIFENEKYTGRLKFRSISCRFYHRIFKTHLHYWVKKFWNTESGKNILIADNIGSIRWPYNDIFLDSEDDFEKMYKIIDEFITMKVNPKIDLLLDFNSFLDWCKSQDDIMNIKRFVGDNTNMALLIGLFDKEEIHLYKNECFKYVETKKNIEESDHIYLQFCDTILSDDFKLYDIVSPDMKWFDYIQYYNYDGTQPEKRVNRTSINEEFFSLFLIKDSENVLHNKLMENVKADAEKCFLSELTEEQQNIWVGRYHNVTIVVGNHDDDELVDTVNRAPENEISDIIMSSIDNGKAMFLHVYQSYNIISYIIENGEKRIRMMYVHPDIAKMEGAFTPEEKALFTTESNKYNSIDRIFNLHLKELTGLSTINDQSLSDVEMIKN